MPLNPNNIPHALVSLLPMAEKWGIADVFDRKVAITSAPQLELEMLIHSIDAVADNDLYGWLSGSESFNPNPSQEYLALMHLTMAIDSAKAELEKTS